MTKRKETYKKPTIRLNNIKQKYQYLKTLTFFKIVQ